MSSRAVRRLQRDKDIIVIPEIDDNDEANDSGVRNDSKPKNKKKQKAVNLFAQVVTSIISVIGIRYYLGHPL